MESLLSRLIGQLDTLIPFLALSREEIFRIIRRSEAEWFSADQRSAVPQQFAVYETQVTHAAFLLGYSYFEAFLSDLLRAIYRRRPAMLPPEKELNFKEVLDLRSYKAILSRMIDKEVFALFHRSMREIVEYFERKLKLTWPSGTPQDLVRASLLRNCVIHNMARATPELAGISRFRADEEIKLTVGEVHEMGLIGRHVASELYEQAERAYFSRPVGRNPRGGTG